MNRYIVVTEKRHEVVYADGVTLDFDCAIFYEKGDDKDYGERKLIAAFKGYECFLLDEEDVVKPGPVKKENYLGINEDAARDISNTPSYSGTENDSTKIALVSKADIKKQRKKEPWSIPLKDKYSLRDMDTGYGRIIDYKNEGRLVVMTITPETKEPMNLTYYLVDRGVSICPASNEPAIIRPMDRSGSFLWAYYDKDGNLERAEIR